MSTSARAVLLTAALFPWTIALAAAQQPPASQADLVKQIVPMAVNIIGHTAAAGPDEGMAAAAQTGKGLTVKNSDGAGFIIDPSGIIVTNWHVLNNCYEVFVTFSDGTMARAEILNAARTIDIALLKVNVGHDLPAVRFGDSNKVQVGDPVLAVGNPLGIGQSVTSGIVSALKRSILETPTDFIQTDAPINHGNSGGPLFNMQGELIGINTALVSSTASSAGLGFAIPSNEAHKVIERLTHPAAPRPSYIGMKAQQLTQDMAAALGQPDTHASIVAQVLPGGPAARAGLQVGDIILSYGALTPSGQPELLRAIAATPAGQPVKIGILRGGKPAELTATLDEWPAKAWEQRDAPVRTAEPDWNIPGDLGLKLKPLTAAERKKAGLADGAPGVAVAAVAPGADAGRAGVDAGDLLIRIGDTPIATPADFQREIDRVRGDGQVFAMALLLKKAGSGADAKPAEPKWLALRVAH